MTYYVPWVSVIRNPLEMGSEVLRVEGKKLYQSGRWIEAIAKYGTYIDLLLEEGDSNGRLMLGYSNRAQALLQVGIHVDALEDIERALNLDPHHLKSLVRKAKALGGLKLYQEAVAIYRTSLERGDLHVDNLRTIQFLLRDTVMKDKQTRLGQFEDFVNDWWKAPDLAQGGIEEFVGPVELKRVSGMDRGLFATRDLYPGELLFVSSAMTSVKHPKGAGGGSQVTSSLVGALEKMVTQACQNLEDFSQVQLLVQLDALAGPYPTGPLSRDTPHMKYFTPVNALAPHLRKLSTHYLQYPTFPTQFNRDKLLEIVRKRQYIHWGMKNSDITGIYCLPSLINHSCLPNVTVTSAGSVNITVSKFFRASQKIKKGDELFSAYHSVFCPLDDRRAFCQVIICKCERCVWEERLLKEIPALRALEQRCSKFWQERPTMIRQREGERTEIRSQCIESIGSMNQLLRTDSKLQLLSTKKKDWLRAVFIRFYRLLLDPALALSQNSSEHDHLLQLRMIRQAVRVMRAIDPASDIAMAISSEAFRQTTTWREKSQSGVMGLFEQTHSSLEITQLLMKLYMEGLEIGRLLYGSQLEQQTLDRMFFWVGPLLVTPQNS